MRKCYETVMVIKPTIEEDLVKDVVDKVLKFLKKNDAEVLRENNWGKKRLAYEIGKYKRAYYYQIIFESGPEVNRKLERYYQLSEDIIRSMIIIPEKTEIKPHDNDSQTEEITREETADGKSE